MAAIRLKLHFVVDFSRCNDDFVYNFYVEFYVGFLQFDSHIQCLLNELSLKVHFFHSKPKQDNNKKENEKQRSGGRLPHAYQHDGCLLIYVVFFNSLVTAQIIIYQFRKAITFVVF